MSIQIEERLSSGDESLIHRRGQEGAWMESRGLGVNATSGSGASLGVRMGGWAAKL